MTSISAIPTSPVARTEKVSGDRSGDRPDAFLKARDAAEWLTRTDDTTRTQVRVDNNLNTQLTQSEFDTGRASTIQPAGRLPAPAALFAQASSEDTRASRTELLDRRPGSTENRVGAVSVGTSIVGRNASGIEQNAAENLRLAEIQTSEGDAGRFADAFTSTVGLSRNSAVGRSDPTLADFPQDLNQGQQQVRQYQQVGASTSSASASGNVVSVVA